MTQVTDQYRQLFGREGTSRGTDIDMSEHGRVGDVSTGQPYKHIVLVDPTNGYKAQVGSDGKVSISDGGGSITVDHQWTTDSNNSTVATLGSGEVFTGTATDLTGYKEISVSAISDKASATDGLTFQFSQDGTNWDHVSAITLPAGNEITTILAARLKYFRIVYTNSAAVQTYFRLQTRVNGGTAFGTVREISITPTDSDLAQVTRSIISGKTTAGGSSYVDVKVTPSGAVSAATTAADGDVFVRSNSATTFPVSAVGNVAAGATDSGNPVKVGGKYNSTRPTLSDGQRGDLQLGSRGSAGVELFVNNSTAAASYAATNADDVSAGSVASRLEVVSRETYFDGSTWDRMRGDSTNGLLVYKQDYDVTLNTNYAKKYYTNAGAVTDGIVWSPAAGKRWHVVSMIINVSAAATVTLEDDLAGGDSPVWKGELAANSGFTLNFGDKYPLASGEDAADLLVTTTAGNIYITCVGYEI